MVTNVPFVPEALHRNWFPAPMTSNAAVQKLLRLTVPVVGVNVNTSVLLQPFITIEKLVTGAEKVSVMKCSVELIHHAIGAVENEFPLHE